MHRLIWCLLLAELYARCITLRDEYISVLVTDFTVDFLAAPI